MKDFKIFYSWQSDRNGSTNRNLIEDSLQRAIKAIKLDESPVEPFLDRDTKGIPGSPNIVDSILNKIDQFEIFVADLTIVTSDNSSRAIPNPNVLIELGYAIKSLGLNRVILIMNTAYGAINILPFDLHHLRIMTYSLHEDQLAPSTEAIAGPEGEKRPKPTLKAEQRQDLARSLETAIRLIIEQHSKEEETIPINEGIEKTTQPIEGVQSLKDALEKDSNPLTVSRILGTETEKAIESLNKIKYFRENRKLGPEELAAIITETDAAMSDLIENVAFGCAHGEPKYEKIWAENLTLITDETAPQRTIDRYRFYPALVYFYAGGIAAVAEENYRSLAVLINKSKIRNNRSQGLPETVAYNLVPYRVIDEHDAKRLPVIGSYKVPLSSHLRSMLYPKMKAVIRNEQDFTRSFVRFEYLFALTVAAQDRAVWGGASAAVPVGSYFWESYLIALFSGKQPFIVVETEREIKSQGERWKPYEAGLIDLSWENFLELKSAADENLLRQLKGDYPELDISKYPA